MSPGSLLVGTRNWKQVAHIPLEVGDRADRTPQSSGTVMRRAVLVLVSMSLVGACGGTDGDAVEMGATSPTEPGGTPIVIRTRMTVAAEEGAEPIATGEVLGGSTLGGSPFCAGGSILDTHASADPAMEPYGLIDRTITCPDGTVRMGFSPAATQTVSWTIVSGTGAFEGLHGTGEFQVEYDPNKDSLALETMTGTVTG